MIRRYAIAATVLVFAGLAAFSKAPGGEQEGLLTESQTGRKGVVASSSAPATRVGVQILRDGGNAIDAAVAVGLALAVTYPAAGNVGGGGFMVIRMKDGRTAAIDFRETAPLRARPDLYLDDEGNLIPRASTEGYQAAGVPGTIAGLGLARDQFGTKKWRDLVEPARLLASDGFRLSNSLARDLRVSGILSRFPESKRVFQKDGKYYAAGYLFRQPDLARTLERIRDNGPREFYEGETARLIAEDMGRNGGLIGLDDLKSYRAVVRKPLSGTYRGYEIITMPPPSSGGVALIQMLNMLESRESQALRTDCAERSHVMIEAMRRAFADRSHFLGDSDFVTVPVHGLTSKAYGKQLSDGIRTQSATKSDMVLNGDPAPYESPQTTHYSVVDAEGNAVAVTYTLNTGFGSGVTVNRAGFLLNNEMDDFTSQAGAPNVFGLIQGQANAIAPSKRPLSSMTPTIVMRGGKPYLVLGSPGGPTIINTVMQVFLNSVDLGMTLKEAVRRARIHHQWLPDRVSYERELPESSISLLKLMGHRFEPRPTVIGDVQAIEIKSDGTRIGVSDTRSPDGLALAE